MFGPKWDLISGGGAVRVEKDHIKNTKYYSDDQVKKNEIGWGMWHIWEAGEMHAGF